MQQTATITILCAAIAIGAGASDAPAASSYPGARGITIHAADEILTERTARSLTGDLLFVDATGSRSRLITSVDDPEISNRGDGAFHAIDPAAVLEALDAIPEPLLRDLEVQIFLLPYPRAGQIGSSADERAIYLSPGVHARDESEQHAVLTHELGHCFHRLHLPDSDFDGWAQYARLRGIEDESIFHAEARHADRPHEVFAEDFRVLFGSASARGDGSIENGSIARPESVAGLRAFYFERAGAALASVTPVLHLFPNPLPEGASLQFAIPGNASRLEATLYDIRGRLIVRTRMSGEGSLANFDVPSDLAAGSYWLRLESDGRVLAQSSLRVTH